MTANEALAMIDRASVTPFGLPSLASDWGQNDGTSRTHTQWYDYLTDYALDRWPYYQGYSHGTYTRRG